MLLMIPLLNACTIEGAIVDLEQISKPEIPEVIVPKLKTSALPTNVPEGYPYRGIAQVENLGGTISYSLVDSTCEGLQIESSSGVLKGILSHKNTEACSYKVKATSDGTAEYVSDLVTLNFSSALTFSFSLNQVFMSKGGATRTVHLNISPAPPFDSEIDYSLFSTAGGNLDYLSGFGSKGVLSLAAAQGAKELTFQIPNTAGLVDTEFQVLALQTGSTTSKPQLNLNLEPSEKTVLQFDQISAGGQSHTCGISSGKLYCWGSHTASAAVTPKQIGTSSTWQVVSAGEAHTGLYDAEVVFSKPRPGFMISSAPVRVSKICR